MKVVFVYRKQQPDAFSIEELFRTIANELRKYIEIVEYEVGSRSDIFRDARALRAMKADVYHITGDINYFSLFLPRKKTVLTIHDIGHYLFGLKGIKKTIYKWIWLSLPIFLVKLVTCISAETEKNIKKNFRISSSKIILIQNCYSPLFKSVAKKFDKNCPIILQVGTKPYKNVPRLINALKSVKCRLVLIGKIDNAISIALENAKLDYSNRFNITHDELVREYFSCDIVSFVSIGEGFGVPIIEAQAVGRPLLTSNISPLREVAGSGACLVDPLDVDAIYSGIRRLIDDESYRLDIVEKGRINAENYSPAVVAKEYLSVYKNIVKNS